MTAVAVVLIKPCTLGGTVITRCAVITNLTLPFAATLMVRLIEPELFPPPPQLEFAPPVVEQVQLWKTMPVGARSLNATPAIWSAPVLLTTTVYK
jgi:hypothetical protein